MVLVAAIVAGSLIALGVGAHFAYQKWRAPAQSALPPQPAAVQPPSEAPAPPPAEAQTPAPPPVETAPAATAPTAPTAPLVTPAKPFKAPGRAKPRSPSQAAPPATAPQPAAAAPPAAEPAAAPPPEEPPKPVAQPERPAPPAPAPVARGYTGPQSGVLVWSGPLQKNGLLTIDGTTASAGSINAGSLPGVPVMITDIQPSDLGLAEAPSASNGWKRIVLRSRGNRRSVVTIKWSVLR
jgi:hypothetical protein